MAVLIGFVVAAIVGLTGIGGGSFATPALVLFLGLPAGPAVGTAMLFAAVLRLIAAPVYLVRQQVHGPYVWSMVVGAIPGLLLGTWLLYRMRSASFAPAVLIAIGALLALSSAMIFAPRLRNPGFARNKKHWLSILAIPIGIETGFTSAGAGIFGSILLLNFSELTPAQVVGTDLLFGISLALVGSIFHLGAGSVDGSALIELLCGGIPGVVLGCLGSRVLSANGLRKAVAIAGILLGLQLVWTGGKVALRNRETVQLRITLGK